MQKTAVPKNLKELLGGDQEGYELRWAYFLELDHHCMGHFPAIISKDNEMIMTTDKTVLEDVGKMLTPRRHKISQRLAYVNAQLGLGFVINGLEDYWLEQSEPGKFYSHADIAAIIGASLPDASPFKWAPGLVGNDMSPKEFIETLAAAVR